MKHWLNFGVYVTYEAIYVQLANKTGYTETDIKALEEALRAIFCNNEGKWDFTF